MYGKPVSGQGIDGNRSCPLCDKPMRRHHKAPSQSDNPNLVNYFFKCHYCGEVRVYPVNKEPIKQVKG